MAGSYAEALAATGGARRGSPVLLGANGDAATNPTLARLARAHGSGEPLMFVDLAAVDRNARVIVTFARANGWAVRPALKAFQCPQLSAYILGRLPQPRGLVFHLRTVDQIMAHAPAGTDLLMGYPPTRGELRAYLNSAPPPGQRRHRLTLLASSVELVAEMARRARTTRRALPLDVGLEFDSGEGRGGFHRSADIAAAIKLLRRHRDRLQLRAVVCYDGHATLTGEEYFLKSSTWPDQGGTQPAFVYPAGVSDDLLEGGRCMVTAPPHELDTEDYVLCWPNQSGDGIDYFGALHAVRGARLLDLWPTFTRWSTP